MGATRKKINKNFKRPVDVKSLCGNYNKAKKTLGWAPKTSFKELVQLMVREDLKKHEKQNIDVKFLKNLKKTKNIDLVDISKKKISA